MLALAPARLGVGVRHLHLANNDDDDEEEECKSYVLCLCFLLVLVSKVASSVKSFKTRRVNRDHGIRFAQGDCSKVLRRSTLFISNDVCREHSEAEVCVYSTFHLAIPVCRHTSLTQACGTA